MQNLSDVFLLNYVNPVAMVHCIKTLVATGNQGLWVKGHWKVNIENYFVHTI